MMPIVAGEFNGVTKIYLVDSSQIHELSQKIGDLEMCIRYAVIDKMLQQ